jgi:tryptophan synthase alpha subunit
MAHATTTMTNPSRIAQRFAALRKTGEMGLVAYLTAGDPSLDATEKFVLALAEAGADVIELGVPFSDPVADGPVIQRASERALRSGTTLAGVLSLVKSLRAKTQEPLVLFSYFNPVLQMGLEKFGDAAKAAGADGVLITDLTPEEAVDYRAAISSRGLDTIFLAAPTSTDGARANRQVDHRIFVCNFAHRRDRREGSTCRRIAGPGSARAALHRASDCHRVRHFAAGACFVAWRIG